jgi:hypothetical protein
MEENEMGMEYEVWMVAFEIDRSWSGRKPVLNDTLLSQFFLNHSTITCSVLTCITFVSTEVTVVFCINSMCIIYHID